MASVQFEKFNINKFWKDTPTVLKYILSITIIIVGSYFLLSKKVSTSQIDKLVKVEQSIENTYILMERFDNYRLTQYTYNIEHINALDKIYGLIENLNYTTNDRIDAAIATGKYDIDKLVEHMIVLNQTIENMQKTRITSSNMQQLINNLKTDTSAEGT